jgi:hypothetical protein
MSDCVFTAFAISGVNQMTLKNLTGTTVRAGTYLPTNPGQQITAYTLSSGSVIEYQ